MTDHDIISQALAALGAEGGEFYLLQKGGKALLALPRNKEAALIALSLYQPQRPFAKLMVAGVKVAIRFGVMPLVLKRVLLERGLQKSGIRGPELRTETVGVLLGNPDHVIRRAIVSFQGRKGFEVAKIAFGKKGVALMEREAATLASLPPGVVGIPHFLGTHHQEEAGVMRMPYLRGGALGIKNPEYYLNLLQAWLLEEKARPVESFSEWDQIKSVLSGQLKPPGLEALKRLAGLRVKPAIRHGDFAPWNLIRDEEGEVFALDWEWGVPCGISGFDLIHYLTQELRLVQRLPAPDILVSLRRTLQSAPFENYLDAAGWKGQGPECFDNLLLVALAFGVSLQIEGIADLLELLLVSLTF